MAYVFMLADNFKKFICIKLDYTTATAAGKRFPMMHGFISVTKANRI
jgi:hypothetical protein